ncbi:hypothetical protein [Streptomyces sp. NPDC060205]|uniref:hypothetical protein n=1 Tax=Streptomyces sp. NPDC060205 TaxID=3347072 RepID=UPI0036538030
MSVYTFGRRASIAGRFWTLLDGREYVVGRPLKRPELPGGAFRELNDELHKLHLLAGWPSTPRMADRFPFSKSTIHAVFSGTTLPTREVLCQLAFRLAEWAVLDPEREEIRFRELWVSAAQAEAVVGGNEGQQAKSRAEHGRSGEQEPRRADGEALQPPQGSLYGPPLRLLQRGYPEIKPVVGGAGLDPDAAWLETAEWALAAILLSLFPRKSGAYEFLSMADVPSEFYVVGDPGTIGYWVGIVEYVRDKSSVEGLSALGEWAAKTSESAEQRLRGPLGVLREKA